MIKTKKPRFAISESLKQGLVDTVNMVETHAGVYRNTVIPLSRIDLDPENPRRLAIQVGDLPEGPQKSDKNYKSKYGEFLKLSELAESIKREGIIHPIITYKVGDRYQLVAGERRFLASMIIGKHNIESRVFNDKPTGFRLKFVQWIENNEREDLPLQNKVMNVRELVNSYREENPKAKLNALALADIIGLSTAQASCYFSALNAPEDVKLAIDQNIITSLDKVAVIAAVADSSLRKKLIMECQNGLSLSKLRAFIKQHKESVVNLEQKYVLKKPGRSAQKVKLGDTKSTLAAKKVIEAMLSLDEFKSNQSQFSGIKWDDCTEVSSAFQKLFKIIEENIKR